MAAIEHLTHIHHNSTMDHPNGFIFESQLPQLLCHYMSNITKKMGYFPLKKIYSIHQFEMFDIQSNLVGMNVSIALRCVTPYSAVLHHIVHF